MEKQRSFITAVAFLPPRMKKICSETQTQVSHCQSYFFFNYYEINILMQYISSLCNVVNDVMRRIAPSVTSVYRWLGKEMLP